MRPNALVATFLTACCLFACGGSAGSSGTNNTKQVKLSNMGQTSDFTIENVKFTLTKITADIVQIDVQNLNQADQVKVVISNSVTGAVILFSKSPLPPNDTTTNRIKITNDEQLHFEVDDVGTNFNPPIACNTSNGSCVSTIDVSVQL